MFVARDMDMDGVPVKAHVGGCFRFLSHHLGCYVIGCVYRDTSPVKANDKQNEERIEGRIYPSIKEKIRSLYWA